MTRVIVTGDRHWPCVRIAEAVLDRLEARYGGDLVIVHGDCRTGVDAAFDDVATRRRLTIERHPADWSRGRRAGPERNRAMVLRGAEFCIAVHRALGRSRGTRGTVELALANAIPCYWIASNDCRPARVLGFGGFEVLVAEKARV